MAFSHNPVSSQRNLSPASIVRTACAVLAACGALLWLASPASAETVRPALVQTIDTSAYSPPSPDPAGIAYMPAQDRLLISDSEVNEMPLFQGYNLFTATRTGSGVGSGNVVSYSGEPSDLGIDTANGRLFIADDDRNRVFIVSVGPDNVYGTADDTRSNFRTSTFGSDDPEGVVFDALTGHLFVSDGLGVEIYDVNPVNGVFGDGNDTVTHFDLAQYGAGDCEGLGIDPALGRLLCVDPSTPDNIYEVGRDGALFRILSMAALPTSHAVVADVTMAPSSNPNDDPATMNYWIVDRHLDNGNHPDENDGLLYEMSLDALPPPPPPQRTLAVQTQGAGTGTVTGPGIECPGDCTETYANGQQVSLTVSPSGGSSFGGWSGACSGTGPCQLTMDADKQATATFNPGSPGSLFTVPIRAGADDGDENQGGTVRRTNGDLNLGSGSGGSPTTAALRFTGVQVPNGATITSAEVQFTADETGNASTNLVIRAERNDNSAPIATTAFNISSRPRTVASVAWPVPAWLTVGAAGPGQLTPNLASVVQEVVNRPGWAAGNALTVILTGSGRRAAESFEGGAPPVLRVQYVTP